MIKPHRSAEPAAPCRLSRRRGFTIIELLVVISIIALLISILLPSLAGARDRARFIKWAGYSQSLRTDSNLSAYYNFEQQDGTEENSKGEPILWNRAAGDAMGMAREAVEPEDFNARGGSRSGSTFNAGVNSPIWNTQITEGTRWAGKAAGESEGVSSTWRTYSVKNNPLMEKWFSGYTVAIWIRPDVMATATGPTNYVWEKGSKMFLLKDDQSVSKGLSSRQHTTASQIRADTKQAIEEDAWSQIVCTFDTTIPTAENRCYVNGKLKETTSHAAGQRQLDPSTIDLDFSFGAGDNNGTSGFDGLIDELAVFNGPIPDDQIDTMYKVGRPRRRE